MRGLVVGNLDDDDTGFVGQRLEHHGYQLERCVREKPDEWPAADEADLIVLLGSEWSVYWPYVSQFVEAEAAFVRTAHEHGVPMLAICFGAQMVAHALGGSVGPASRPEIGWQHIDSDVPDAIATGPWMQWHFDTVALPAGATELARSDLCPQTFLLDRTLAVQFHPEATLDVVERWSVLGRDTLVALDLDPGALSAAAVTATALSGPNTARLVDWFLHTTTP